MLLLLFERYVYTPTSLSAHLHDNWGGSKRLSTTKRIVSLSIVLVEDVAHFKPGLQEFLVEVKNLRHF